MMGGDLRRASGREDHRKVPLACSLLFMLPPSAAVALWRIGRARYDAVVAIAETLVRVASRALRGPPVCPLAATAVLLQIHI